MIERPGSVGPERVLTFGAKAPQAVVRARPFTLDAHNQLPPRPPQEVLVALDRAQGSLQELRLNGYRAGFRLDGDGGLSVELRDARGQVVGELRATHALETLSNGDSLLEAAS